MSYTIRLLPLLAATVVFATPVTAAFATSLPGQLPGCSGSIDSRQTAGCRMRGEWFAGAAAGQPAAAPSNVPVDRPAVARAIVPQGADLLGRELSYVVHFKADDAAGLNAPDDTLAVKIWLADDQNRYPVPLRDFSMTVGSDGPAPVTVQARGTEISYRPHYVYVSFAPTAQHGQPVTVSGVEFGIVPSEP